MKNHELLDMIGEASEDYVQAADSNVVRPRFRWKALAACAACVALALCAYPAWQGAQPYQPLVDYDPSPAPEATQDPARTLIQAPGLHDYTLVKQNVHIISTMEDTPPQPNPIQPPRGDGPDPAPGGGGDAPVSEEASAQYDRLLLWMLGTDQPEPFPDYPEWFGGAWLDNDWPDNMSRLTVAIVDGFRTPGLEAQITAACGGTGDVLFTGVKYSQACLDGLMDGIARIFEEQNVRISSAYGVYVMDNYLGLDFFGGVPSDETLAALAELDPDGGAIRIQVFHDGRLSWTDDPAEPAGGENFSCDPGEYDPSGAQPVDDPPEPTPIDRSGFPADPSAAPGGVTQPGSALEAEDGGLETARPAVQEPPQQKYDAYDVPGQGGGPAHYDVIDSVDE